MALGDYLSSLSLDPGTAAKLQAMAQPRDGGEIDGPAPVAGDGIDASPVSPEEVARYNAMITHNGEARPATPADTARDQAAVERVRSGAPLGAPAPAPEASGGSGLNQGRTADRAKYAEDSKPQGPAGSDGFPTYRDLNNTGSAGNSAPAGPMRVVPGGWRDTARSETVQHGLDKAILQPGEDYRDEGHVQGQLAGMKHLEAAQQAGMADAVYAASHAAASKQAADEIQRIENEKRAYVQREGERLNELAIKAQEKVDPDAARGSSGAQLFAAIGIALGEFGASLKGGQNTALQIVQSNIDRNIAAQQANINNAHKNLDNAKGLYAQNLAAFGDKERATLATKVQYLDQVKAMADQQYAAAKHTMNEGDYHAFLQKLEDGRAQTVDQFNIRSADQKTSQHSQHYQQAQVVGGAGGDKTKGPLFVPTLGGYALDAETARKLNASGAIRMQVNEDLRTIDHLLKEAKGLNSVTDYSRMQEIRDEINSRKNNVLQRTTVLRGQGAMSNGDKDVAEVGAQMAGIDPQLKTAGQIDRMRKGVANVARLHQVDHRLEGEANHIQLGQEVYVNGPNGPEARALLAGRNKVVSKKTEGVDDLFEKSKGVVKE